MHRAKKKAIHRAVKYHLTKIPSFGVLPFNPEIEALKRGEMIEKFDMYREKFKKFRKWKKLHDVVNVPDHYVASDFRKWDEQIKTQEDYDNYVMDLDFYV